ASSPPPETMTERPPAARLAVKVVPKSSRDRIAGWVGGALKVCVTAPPERGKANAAVAAALADALGVPPGAIRLVSGAASPRKVFEVDLEETELRRRLPA
ncbi:MAG: DUF167 domain-containing protein, partial [Candidatus Binatia bacterium]